MGRKKIKPGYDPEQIQKELIEICKSLYLGNKDEYEESDNKLKYEIKTTKGMPLRSVASELNISVGKVIKLLITGDCYSTEISERIDSLYAQGMTANEIQQTLGVSRATVQSYLPYKKGVYNAKDISLNAERIRKYRKRQDCVSRLNEEMSEEALWDTVVAFQDYLFYTAGKKLPFRYTLKTGRDGTPNKELLISLRKESKTLTWSSIRLAFNKVKEHQDEVFPRPKAIGDIRGISYVYAMFLRWGIVRTE